jgi:sugar (pentulose or hexulose) kinase
LRTGCWHSAALAKLGLDRLTWPQLTTVDEPLGDCEMGSRRLTCYPVLGDQQCALCGVGLREDELSLNVSTGAQVSRITRGLELGAYQSRRYLDGRYLNTITHLPAGRSLNVLVNLLSELSHAEGLALADPWSYITRAAAAATGDGLECDLAFFAGPLGSTGRVSQITLDNLTVGNLFHSAFRNMAENFSLCATRLCPERDWRGIALSGGLTQSVPILRQLIEREFSQPLRESTESEETLMGLLQVAQRVLTGTVAAPAPLTI